MFSNHDMQAQDTKKKTKFSRKHMSILFKKVNILIEDEVGLISSKNAETEILEVFQRCLNVA